MNCLSKLAMVLCGKRGSVDRQEDEAMEIVILPTQRSQYMQNAFGPARLPEWPIRDIGHTVVCPEDESMDVDSNTTREEPQHKQNEIDLAMLPELPTGSTGRTAIFHEGKSMEVDSITTRKKPQRTQGTSRGNERRSVSQDGVKLPRIQSASSGNKIRFVTQDGVKLPPAKPARTLSAFTGLMDRTLKPDELHSAAKTQNGRPIRAQATRARSQPAPEPQEIVQPTTCRISRCRNLALGSSTSHSPMISQLQREERRIFRSSMYELQLKWKAEKEKRKAEQRLEYLRRTSSVKKTNHRAKKN